jgi:S-adenosylmethionine decarboxylase
MKDGTHLILDLKDCEEIKRLSSKRFIRKFILKAVDISKMKPISKPMVIYYEPKEKEESGVTGFIIILDSHISVHTYPFKKSLYFDLFSCKSFDSDKMIDYSKEVFKPKRIHKKLIKR